MGIDRDRPQSVMEALIIALPFGLPTAIVVAPAKQLFVPLAKPFAMIFHPRFNHDGRLFVLSWHIVKISAVFTLAN